MSMKKVMWALAHCIDRCLAVCLQSYPCGEIIWWLVSQLVNAILLETTPRDSKYIDVGKTKTILTIYEYCFRHQYERKLMLV